MDDPKKNYDVNLQAAQRAHDRNDELQNQLNDGAFKAAQAVLGTLVTINGGAIVTLFALAGATVAHGNFDPDSFERLMANCSEFIYGVVAAIVAMCAVFFAYFVAGYCYVSREKRYEHPYIIETRRSRNFRLSALTILIAGIVLGAVSMMYFWRGVVAAQNIIGHLFSSSS